jgi:hypothetical protein
MKQPKATREKELETILTLCVALVVLFFVTKKQHAYYLTLSLLLGLIGMFSKFLTAKISWAWLKLGEMMGAVMSKVILSLIFFVFLFPIAVLSRLFNRGKDNLHLQKSNDASYYFIRNHKYEAKDLENVW